MPQISINGNTYEYLDSTIINFVEGLIGFPTIKQAVLISNPEFQPFHWLASVDDESSRFIVVEPADIFAGYNCSEIFESVSEGAEFDPDTLILTIVNVSSEWKNTTFNLRAPIILNPHTRKAAQVILSNSHYRHNESLPE